MIEQIKQRLREWEEKNLLSIIEEGERHFRIPEFGSFYLLIPDKEGKLIDRFMLFLHTEEDVVEAEKADYLLFEFGRRFYYCKKEIQKDDFNEYRFVVNFNDLKYLGHGNVFLPNFPNIGIHTEYEILNGSGLKNYIKKAKFLGDGVDCIGLCDKFTLAGTLNFQQVAEKEGFHAIIGASYDIVEFFDIEQKIQITYEVKLYATSEQGWSNLLFINKTCNVDFVESKVVPEQVLMEHGTDLICVFTRNSYFNFADKKALIKRLMQFKKTFRRIYYQIDSVEFYDDAVDLEYLQQINTYFKSGVEAILPPILINDTYYCDKEDYIVKDYLNKVAGKAHDYSEDQYYKTADEVVSQFAALFHSQETFFHWYDLMLENLAELCNLCKGFKLETGERKFPIYEFAPEGFTNEELFLNLINDGFQNKILERHKDAEIYMQRLEHEFNVIKKAGLIDYLLILWDIVSWCNENGIYVGPGRGSVGGSLIAFLIGITAIDPIEHNLLFERFLNEVRVAPEIKYRLKLKDGTEKVIPAHEFEKANKELKIIKFDIVEKFKPDAADVDLDFESAHRDTVKGYIVERFGSKYSCSIGTFTRLKLRAALKDFGKVRGLKFSYVNFITKAIENQLEYTFRDFVRYAVESVEFKKFFQLYPDLVHVVKYAMGQPKAYSIHASGVLVLPKVDKNGQERDVLSWLPVRLVDGKYVSEWEGKFTDASGFLKEDILGLSQLDKFKNINQLIYKNHKEIIDLDEINYNDPKTYRLFQKGLNHDVFQFNQNGLKQYSRQVKPDCFEDLVAMNALYRPGPMDSNAHTDFVLMKHGKKKAHFDFGLREVTKNTQGLYIYQEQIMQAVVVLGGFSASESDDFRKNIKKFDKVKMAENFDKFLAGAVERGCDKKEAEKIWNKLLAFGGYGFNKCLSGDTNILLSNGEDIKLSELYIKCKIKKMELLSLNNNKLIKQKIKNVFATGIQKVYKIKLKNGLEINVTENHKLLTNNGFKNISQIDLKADKIVHI